MIFDGSLFGVMRVIVEAKDRHAAREYRGVAKKIRTEVLG